MPVSFFFHLQNGAKNITVLCIWGFSFHFSPGLPLDPSSSFSLSKHLTLQVTMKITGHRWKVFEMLKQHQVLKPVYIGGGIRGSCRKRNLNLIKLTVTRGALRERWLAHRVSWENTRVAYTCVSSNRHSIWDAQAAYVPGKTRKSLHYPAVLSKFVAHLEAWKPLGDFLLYIQCLAVWT